MRAQHKRTTTSQLQTNGWGRMDDVHGLVGCLQHSQVVVRRSRHKPTLIAVVREQES